jgi:hypothetical protein
MSWFSRFSQPRVRVAGPPPSGNGASSFHLWWMLPTAGPFSEVTAVFEVTRPPEVARLYFWALQVSFVEAGRELGAGHTGLQWHPSAPAGAVNWGGYYSGGAPAGSDGTLPGTESALPPVDGNPHTRHFPWSAGRKYRFRVWSPTEGAWRSEVTDVDGGGTTVVRDLLVDAHGLASPLVWSEVFAACDDPPTEVRWSQLEAIEGPGQAREGPIQKDQIKKDQIQKVRSVRLTYQSFADGGCSNTETYADEESFVQVTGLRAVRPGAPDVLTLAAPGTSPSA